MAKHARKKFLVQKGLQFNTILGITLTPTIVLALTLFLVAVFWQQLVAEARIAAVDLPSLKPLFMTMVGFVVIAQLVAVYQALRISHRVAGPLVQIQRTLKQFRDGDHDARIGLRKDDLVCPHVDEINAMLDWFVENTPQDTAETPTETEQEDAQEPVAAGRS